MGGSGPGVFVYFERGTQRLLLALLRSERRGNGAGSPLVGWPAYPRQVLNLSCNGGPQGYDLCLTLFGNCANVLSP